MLLHRQTLYACCTGSRLQSQKKKERSSQGSSDQGKGDRVSNRASGSEARDRSSSGKGASQEGGNPPRRVLRKEGHEKQVAESDPRKEKSETSRAKAAKSSEVRLLHICIALPTVNNGRNSQRGQILYVVLFLRLLTCGGEVWLGCTHSACLC